MSLHSANNPPSPRSASRPRSSSVVASEPQWPTRPQSQEINDTVIWPTKVPQSPTRTHIVTPSNNSVPRRSTESTAQRMSFSATSLSRFSLQRIKSNGKSLEQPPPLPTSAPPKPLKKRKTLEVKAATGSLKGVHRRASGIEKRVSASINPNSNTCTPPRTPTRLTHTNPASPTQAQAQITDDTHTPLPQGFTPPHVLKQKRSFFRRMADRLTRSRTSLRDEYKDKEDSVYNENHPHATRQHESEVIDGVIRESPRSRQITPSPSSASLRPSNHLPSPQSSALPSPSLRSRPPSPHPPPTQALPPTPISNTVSHIWDANPLGAPPTDYDTLPLTPISTRSRKSRPPAIKVPCVGAGQDAVLVVGDENGPKSPSRPSTLSQLVIHDVTSISPTSALHHPSPRLPPSPDTRAPLPLSFPLPPMSPPGCIPSPRANSFTSRSFTSPPTSFSTPTNSAATTPRKTSSVDTALPPPGKLCIPQRKAESARGGDAVEKGLDVIRGRPEPLVASREEPVAFEKGLPKIRDRAATLGERELDREGGRSRANSHARADSHTLAGFDLQMQMRAASVQAAISSTTSCTVTQALPQERIENHLLVLGTEQKQGHCRADSPTSPLSTVNTVHSAVKPTSDLASAPTPLSSPNATTLEGRPPIRSQFGFAGSGDGSSGGFTLPNASLRPSNIITDTDGSSVHVVHTESDASSSGDESCDRVNRWLASPTEMSVESTSDHTPLDVWKEELARQDDDDDNVMPEVERMALEAEERVRQVQEKERDTVENIGGKPKKKRSLFGRRERKDSSISDIFHTFSATPASCISAIFLGVQSSVSPQIANSAIYLDNFGAVSGFPAYAYTGKHATAGEGYSQIHHTIPDIRSGPTSTFHIRVQINHEYPILAWCWGLLPTEIVREEDEVVAQDEADTTRYKSRGRALYTIAAKSGNSIKHTVYEADVVKKYYWRPTFLNNCQTWIERHDADQAAQNIRPTPSHYLLDEVHKEAKDLARGWPQAEVLLQWSPGTMMYIESCGVASQQSNAHTRHSPKKIIGQGWLNPQGPRRCQGSTCPFCAHSSSETGGAPQSKTTVCACSCARDTSRCTDIFITAEKLNHHHVLHAGEQKKQPRISHGVHGDGQSQRRNAFQSCPGHHSHYQPKLLPDEKAIEKLFKFVDGTRRSTRRLEDEFGCKQSSGH
ncbi:hypothetical protein BU17DRAFT_62541 [Hysterangium stoloniferum]|nr:hypothetical protein BU17DRAFT_62541 [Hysterangium stoloniferum]